MATTTTSAQVSWEQNLRMELAELMDELDPGWGSWRPPETDTPSFAG